MAMFGIGMPELVVILVVALIVLGVELGLELLHPRSIGRAVGEFRRQSNEVMEEFQAQLDAEERPAPGKDQPKKPATEAPEARGSA